MPRNGCSGERRAAALLSVLCVGAMACADEGRGPRTFDYGWTQIWGGADADFALSLASSEAGLHVAGTMYGASPDAAWQNRSGNGIVAVTTFDARGALVRRVRLDGARVESRPRIAATSDGAVYIAALGETVELPSGLGEPRKFQQQGYVVRFEANGEQAWTHTWPVTATSVELGIQPSIAVTSGGDLIVSAVQAVGGVGFIARLRAADGSEVWSNEVQTSVRAVAVDGDAIYVYGSEWRANVADGWLRKLDADGGELWTRTWGDGATTFGARSPAGGPEPAAQLCILPDAGVVVAGSFVALGAMTAFDANDARALVPARGGADTFVAAFSADGDRRWVLGWGGPWNDGAAGVSVAPDGSLFIAGWFQGSAVMPDDKRIQGTGLEAIVVALAADGSYLGARTFGGPGDDTAYDIRVLPDGALALTGSFERSVDFGLQSEADVRTSAGYSDAYLTQFRFRPELHTKAPDPVQRPSCKRDLDTLPVSFEACLAMGGDAIAGPEDTTCFIQWCAPSPEFGKCRTLGGGISVSDGAVSRTCCKIVYPEAGCPCLGNACD